MGGAKRAAGAQSNIQGESTALATFEVTVDADGMAVGRTYEAEDHRHALEQYLDEPGLWEGDAAGAERVTLFISEA